MVQDGIQTLDFADVFDEALLGTDTFKVHTSKGKSNDVKSFRNVYFSKRVARFEFSLEVYIILKQIIINFLKSNGSEIGSTIV